MIIHVKSVSQIIDAFGLEKPRHPSIVVLDLSKMEITEPDTKIKVVVDLYGITLKVPKSDAAKVLKYGRSYIDFAEGCLFGVSPGQTLEPFDVATAGDFEGWALYFHPDLLSGHELRNKISAYSFFNYATNEALHLSKLEIENLNSVIRKIQEECLNNIDDFSRDVLVSNIDLLLNYVKRYYHRQFITRKSQNSDLLTKFEQLLKNYFDESNLAEQNGLPTVLYFSKKLHLTPNYLSDLLKKETGKNTQEHIHFHLIEKAKYLLLTDKKTVSEIAYGLGFEHPPYFSRLFKKKTGLTPSDYKNSILEN